MQGLDPGRGVTFQPAASGIGSLAHLFWVNDSTLLGAHICRGLTLNAVTFNPLLVACEASGQLDTALGLLAEMKERGISRDAYTYSTLISCCKVLWRYCGGTVMVPLLYCFGTTVVLFMLGICPARSPVKAGSTSSSSLAALVFGWLE